MVVAAAAGRGQVRGRKQSSSGRGALQRVLQRPGSAATGVLQSCCHRTADTVEVWIVTARGPRGRSEATVSQVGRLARRGRRLTTARSAAEKLQAQNSSCLTSTETLVTRNTTSQSSGDYLPTSIEWLKTGRPGPRRSSPGRSIGLRRRWLWRSGRNCYGPGSPRPEVLFQVATIIAVRDWSRPFLRR